MQASEGAPEPPRLGVEVEPITISDTSDGNEASGGARPMEEETSTSHFAGRTPWPAGLRALEEQRKMEEEEEERERKATRPSLELQQQQQPQSEEQQQLPHQQEEQQQQEQRQQQQQGGQEDEPLEPPPQGLAQPAPTAPQEPGDREENLPVYGPPTLAWLLLGAPAAIRAEPG